VDQEADDRSRQEGDQQVEKESPAPGLGSGGEEGGDEPGAVEPRWRGWRRLMKMSGRPGIGLVATRPRDEMSGDIQMNSVILPQPSMTAR
jgi:hypothetical protein